MSGLVISGLKAGVGGPEILRGIDLTVEPGEVHAVMGPNGSGKSTLSHVIMGKPGYEVTAGSITLDGVEMIGMPTWKRAHAGLFLAMQYPIEVPGVSLADVLGAALSANGRTDNVAESVATETDRVGMATALITRAMNVDLSGGEKKRNEIVQMGVLRPTVAVLDEIDSGLDVDALKAVARRVVEMVAESGIGVLVITHYSRLLEELVPDRVSVLRRGQILHTGGPELAEELERTGYAGYEDADSDQS